MERERPHILNLRIPVAMIEQKLEALRGQLGGRDTDLTAQLAASLAIRGVTIPDTHCRVGNSYRLPSSPPTGQTAPAAEILAVPAAPSADVCNPAPDSQERHSISDTNADAGIASHLSPSQCNNWSDCQARWAFGKVYNLPDPKNSNLAMGTAVHEALAFNFHQKLETRCDLPAAEVAANFDVAWKQVLDITRLGKDEKPAELADKARALATLYMRDVAPHIHPVAVEKELRGVIGGVVVHCIPDVIDRDGIVHDTKVLAQTPSVEQHVFQLATYAHLAGVPKGRVDALVKTKRPKYVSLTRTIDAQDLAGLEKQYPLAQEGMRAGVYMPNRRSLLCTRKNCSFWSACEDEFGGRVRP